jgi:dienelactone hydrolase
MRVLSLLMDSKYEKYVDMLAGAMVFSGKAVMRNLEQLKSVPILAYHGVNDTVIRASNIVSIRKKAPENLTLNLFKAGHNTWDAAWNNIRRDTVSFRDFQSDPYVSVWRFLSAIDNGSSISKPELPERDIELYIDGEYIDDLYFNHPYPFRDFQIMIQKK